MARTAALKEGPGASLDFSTATFGAFASFGGSTGFGSAAAAFTCGSGWGSAAWTAAEVIGPAMAASKVPAKMWRNPKLIIKHSQREISSISSTRILTSSDVWSAVARVTRNPLEEPFS
jgi:hypothetical protein